MGLSFLLLGVVGIYYNERYKRLYQLPQQLWRAVLLMFTPGLCVFAASHRLYDGRTLGPEFGYLMTRETGVVLLSIASAIIWDVVLRNPEGLPWLPRPSVRYRRALIILSAATIISKLALLIWMLAGSLATPSLRFGAKPSVVLSLTHLALFLAASCLYLWIVWHFLSDAHVELHEPVIPIQMPIPGASGEDGPQFPEGHLSRAYSLQCASHLRPAGELCQSSQPSQSSESSPGAAVTRHDNLSVAATLALGLTLGPAHSHQDPHQTCPPTLQCATLARFDYLCQARAVPHSWLSDRLLLLVMVTYSTIILALACTLLYEDNFSRHPSPKAKCGLRAPLGCYLVCAYAMQPALRISTFLRSQMSLPEPWIEIRSLIGRSVFVDSNTGASTAVDPRLRVFPIGGPGRGAGTAYPEHTRGCNRNPASCMEYWGHLGRAWSCRRRATPIYLLLYLGFAYFLYHGGFRCISEYPYHLNRGSIREMERARRMMTLVFAVKMCNRIMGFPIHVYSACSFFGFLRLWSSASKGIKGKHTSNTR